MSHGLWVRVFGSIFDHPKTRAVAKGLETLGVPKAYARDVAVSQWIRLVHWARSSREDGRVDLLDAEDFARILRSDLDPEGLRSLWLSSGFVDDGQTLHEVLAYSNTHARTHAQARSGTHSHATHTLGTDKTIEEQIKPPTPLQGDGASAAPKVAAQPQPANIELLHRQWIAIRDSRSLSWIQFDRLTRKDRRTFARLLTLCREDLDLATKALRRFHSLPDRWVEQRGFDLGALSARVDHIVSLVLPVPVKEWAEAPKVEASAEPAADPEHTRRTMANFLAKFKKKKAP